MARAIQNSTRIQAAGNKPKEILEYVGRVNSGREGVLEVREGQAVIAPAGEWVRYSSPTGEGAEYVAVCLPAFSPGAVHRDD